MTETTQPKTPLARALAAAMKEADLNASAFAKKAGLSRNALYKILSNKEVGATTTTLTKLGNAVGAPGRFLSFTAPAAIAANEADASLESVLAEALSKLAPGLIPIDVWSGKLAEAVRNSRRPSPIQLPIGDTLLANNQAVRPTASPPREARKRRS